MLLLTINRKAFMASPMTPRHLTLNDLERLRSRLLGFQSRISHKGTKSGHMLLLIINRKTHGGSNATFRFDLE